LFHANASDKGGRWGENGHANLQKISALRLELSRGNAEEEGSKERDCFQENWAVFDAGEEVR